ncbi:MAG: ATP-dependent DNA helicase [Lachnospiraceae bacterium]|nr:ATP-dependent DNA helicase [Lachnospiraceae bacterium]
MKAIRISVRNLVEFILRSGDIDERRGSGRGTEAMLEGARIHRAIQGAAGSDYSPEVSVREDIFLNDSLLLTVEGRADGIIEENGHTTIDEIKGMYLDVDSLEEPFEVHLAQAKCYASIWAKQNSLDEISVRMTYVGLEDRHIRYFTYKYQKDELQKWFDDLIGMYKPWAEYRAYWEEKREGTIHLLDFPYKYRPGQKELAQDVYKTIYHGKKLFMEAPTGSGKTLATLFPGIKAIGEGLISVIFFLTAKNIGAKAAVEALDLMRDKGLALKSVHVIGKERACVNPQKENGRNLCDPVHCEYAKGHYDRVNRVLFQLLTTEDSFTREVLEKTAVDNKVCPYALTRDLTDFADCVICDYNYVFDPAVALTHFFGENKGSGQYLFLIDEAHNLVDRSRDIFSADLCMKELRHIKTLIKGRDRKLNNGLNSLIAQMAKLEDENSRVLSGYMLHKEIPDVINAAERVAGRFMELYQKKQGPLDEVSDEVLDFYFKINGFIDICSRIDERYRIYTEKEGNGDFRLRLFCVDPSGNLAEYFTKGRATVFFSATLLPVTYYMDLLAGGRDDYSVYASSIFDPDKLGVYINSEVTSKYSRRNKKEYHRIAENIYNVIRCHKGNYIAFFPSYSFLGEVYSEYEGLIKEKDDIMLENAKCICQSKDMSEQDKELFLREFTENNNCLGFCVIGGVFAEGIDLPGERLIGVLIVGTGLPQVNNERDVLKNYFNETGRDGFDYSMKIPGMSKVLQAAGRVIRTEKDTGVIVLFDERFDRPDHVKMFPREWKNISKITGSEYKNIEDFWKRNND